MRGNFRPEPVVIFTEIRTRKKPELQKRFQLRRIALFGSYARGEQTPSSDVDILVDVDPAIGLEFITLADEIENLLETPVELVSRRALKARSLDYIRPDLIDV